MKPETAKKFLESTAKAGSGAVAPVRRALKDPTAPPVKIPGAAKASLPGAAAAKLPGAPESLAQAADAAKVPDVANVANAANVAQAPGLDKLQSVPGADKLTSATDVAKMAGAPAAAVDKAKAAASKAVEKVKENDPGFVQKVLDTIKSVPIKEAVVAFVNTGGFLREVHQEALLVIDRIQNGKQPLWKNLTWETVQKSAAERALTPHIIDQRNLSTCGPAAVLNAMAALDPTQYTTFVKEVFDSARVDGKLCTEGLRESTPPGRMDQCDWMTQSALRNTKNKIFDYKGQPEEQATAISLPEDVAFWFKKVAGYSAVKNYSTLDPLLPGAAKEVVDLFSPTGPFAALFSGKFFDKKTISEAQKAAKDTARAGKDVDHVFRTTAAEEISKLVEKHGDDVVVSLLVEAERFTGGKGGPVPYPNHWVRLLSPIEFKKDGAHCTIFTWGDTMEVHTPSKFGYRFQDTCYVMTVATKKPELLAGVKAIEIPNLLS